MKVYGTMATSVDIKDIQGNIILSTSIKEDSKRKFTLQKEDYVTLKFSLDDPIYFKLGYWVDTDFGLFELVDLYKPNYNESTAAYDYELRLDAYYWKWKNKKLKYSPESAAKETSFSLTATLDVHAGIVLRNLSALGYKYRGVNFTFSIDSTVENKPFLMTYDNINILDACFQMANSAGCECWVTDNIIHFGRCEFGDPVDFELGVNVGTMKRSDSQTEYSTRIIAFGSTRNIPTNYRPTDDSMIVAGVVQKRLMLPVCTSYVDAYENMAQEEAVEDVVVFDDIYPRRVGAMSGVTTKQYTDKTENEDGTTTSEVWNAYRFKDSINFSKDYVISGQDLKIKFESGLLNGLEFGVTFNPDGKPEKINGDWNPEAQIWEIVRNSDYGVNLPNDTLKPANGDTFVLSGFDITFVSDTYIPLAEQELLQKAQEYVAKTKIDPSTYDNKMMSGGTLYEAGDRVNLINPGYFENGRVSRIIGFEYNLDIPTDNPIYTVGETAAYSRIGDIEEKLESITYKSQTYTGTGGSGVYVIRLNDSTVPTNSNVYSSLRQLAMFLRKDQPDEAAELITFIKGIISEDTSYISKLIVGGTSDTVSSGLTEISSEEDTDVVVPSLQETASEMDGSTLGSLTNVNEEVDVQDAYDMVLARLKGDEKWSKKKIIDLKGKSAYEIAVANGYIGTESEWIASIGVSSYLPITSNGSLFRINANIASKAYVSPSSSDTYFYIDIDCKDNMSGEILVRQAGHNIVVFNNVAGRFLMPDRIGDYLYVKYFAYGSEIFAWSQEINLTGAYSPPSTISDLAVVYYDSQAVQLRWTTPHGDQLSSTVTGYDIRYSNSLLSDVESVWNSLKQIVDAPIPQTPSSVANFTIVDLPSNQEYYIYIKSYEIIQGVKYTSKASNFAYCKTSGNTESSLSYRIKIKESQIHTQVVTPAEDYDSSPATIDKMIDEKSLDTFLEDKYPDTSNKSYRTYWKQYMYGRDTAYYRVIIDLYHQYTLDKLFLYSANMGAFSVYAISAIGALPIKVAENTLTGNRWVTINLNTTARFLIFQYDLQEFCAASTNPTIPTGDYGIPEPYYNWNLGQINTMMLYGSSVVEIPDCIHQPLTRSITRRTVGDFFNTNGHFYQSGKLHSLVSGPTVRLYGHPGQFSPMNASNVLQQPSTISDTKFRLNNIPWVYQNGPCDGFVQLLQETYAPYGLKPIITATGVLDLVRLVWNGTKYDSGNQTDNNVYPGLTVPLPKNVTEGLSEYLAIVGDPDNYKVYSKLSFALAAKFGSNNHDALASGFTWNSPDYVNSEPLNTGLSLLGGWEPENEQDKSWVGFTGFHLPEQVYALMSACYDAHESSIIDDAGRNDTYGGKNADNNFKIIMGGLANAAKSGYILYYILRSKAERSDFKTPTDAFNFHIYFSNQSLEQTRTEAELDSTYAVSPEKILSTDYLSGKYIRKMLQLRDLYEPTKEIWVTEFGYGESGGRNTYSRYQCYTMPGKTVGDMVIPDRHRSDVKGAWTVRAALKFMELGVDLCNVYITYSEANWFGNTGAGYEMFRWDELPDDTPGAKAESIKPYEHSGAQPGFNAFGFFGGVLDNGGYPISRSFWYIAVFRNTLSDYIYLGKKIIEGFEKVEVYCFRHKTEDIGAYAIYYNDENNNGVANVPIPVPDNNESVSVISEYIPKIADPSIISNKRGVDQLRTGLPTSRREKFIEGSWVIQNKKPYGVNYESFALGAASYPLNPEEGDEIVVLPSQEENPYFPIVGPVAAKSSGNTGTLLGANQYDYSTIVDGDTVWASKYNQKLAWRQTDAIYDFIMHSPEGIHGRNGNSSSVNVINNTISIDVTEFPKYILFSGIPETSFVSSVSELSAIAINSTSIKLFWNNNNVEDTGYEIFSSSLPESGYTKLTTIDAGSNNTIIRGLLPDTVYYFKIRPIRNEAVGSFSEYVSAKPFSFIPTPSGLESTIQSTTLIDLAWEYELDAVSDFYGFYIYRNSGNGIFSLIGTVLDQAIHYYSDSGLQTGKYYEYKIKAIGLNGSSEYTDILKVRTLTQEEAPAVLTKAETNKLGTQVILTFNVDMSVSSQSLVSLFTLTEGGNIRLIKSISLDSSNPNRIILHVPEDSLGEYNEGLQLRISYTPTENLSLLSAYNVQTSVFDDIVVKNNVGNFTNLAATYKINFAPVGWNPVLVDSTWNNIVGNPESSSVILSSLIDSYGIVSPYSLKSFYSSSIKSWGAGALDGGQFSGNSEEYGEVPSDVYKSYWNNSYLSNQTENTTGKLYFEGLNTSNKYKAVFYGSKRNTETYLRVKCNGVYSEILAENNNSSNFIELDGLQPDSNGTLLIEFICYVDASIKTSSVINFMYLDEFLNEETPPNTYVYLRGLSILEDSDGDGTVTSESINIVCNAIGVALQYRISELEDFSDTDWVSINGNSIPYTILGGYGVKKLFVQLKNDVAESNVKSIEFNYKDPYVPLELKAVYINSDDAITYSRAVLLFVSKNGAPTHYRLSDSESGISSAEWLVWPNTSIPFTLSSGTGTKNVFFQLKDSFSESDIKSDSIMYYEGLFDPIELDSIVIDGGSSSHEGKTTSILFNFTGVPTHYRLSESESEISSTEWLPWSESISYTFTSFGNRSLYAQLKNSGYESAIKSSSIIILETALRVLVARNASNQNTNILYTSTKTGAKINKIPGGSNAQYGDLQLYDTEGNQLAWFSRHAAALYTADINFPLAGAQAQVSSGTNIDSSADDSGIYERAAFQYYVGVSSNATKGNKLRQIFNLPAGSYRIKILFSPGSNYAITEAMRPYCSYYAYAGSSVLSSAIISENAGFTGLANSSFNAEMTFTIDDTTDVTIAAGYTSATATVYGRPGWNLIEITKLN